MYVAFIVYGHDMQSACQAVKVVRPLAELDDAGKSELVGVIAGLKAVGYTPIALGAGNSRQGTGREENSGIVLITDGMESCHGNPAAVAAGLALNPKLTFGVNVIGFGVQENEQQAVEQIAKAGKGKYYGTALRPSSQKPLPRGLAARAQEGRRTAAGDQDPAARRQVPAPQDHCSVQSRFDESQHRRKLRPGDRDVQLRSGDAAPGDG